MPAPTNPQLGTLAYRAIGARFEAELWTGRTPGIIPYRFRATRSRNWQAGSAQDTLNAQAEILRHLGEANLLEADELVYWAPVPVS